MSNTEKIVNKIKEYILKLYSEGYNSHQNMVTGLKNGIDYFVGRDDNCQTIKNEILTTCLTEFDEQVKFFEKAVHLKMVNTIRNNFIVFVNELNVNELANVTSIPYERRLKEEEAKTFKNSLKEKFDFGSWNDENYYWEPLSKTQNKTSTIHFEYNLFNHDDVLKIVEILKSISGERINLLTEDNINYEVETALFDIDWIESTYCDINTNWLIYISHEGTITFAGQELTTRIENELTEIIKHKNPWN